MGGGRGWAVGVWSAGSGNGGGVKDVLRSPDEGTVAAFNMTVISTKTQNPAQKKIKDQVTRGDQTYVDELLAAHSSGTYKTQEVDNTQKLEDELNNLKKLKSSMIKEEPGQGKRR